MGVKIKHQKRNAALVTGLFFVLVVGIFAVAVYLNSASVRTSVIGLGSGQPSVPEKRGPRGAVQAANTIFTVPSQGAAALVQSWTTQGAKDSPQSHFFAYDKKFAGGAVIAVGDVDGDGQQDIVVAAGKGFGPNIKVFSKDGTQKSIQFAPFHPNYRGVLSLAVGDTDGDGRAEIGVCQASEGDQSFCKIYKYSTSKPILAYWKAFDEVRVGATIALADTDGDGRAEAITGAGVGGGPQIRVFDINTKTVTASGQGAVMKSGQFFAGSENDRSGITMAAGDVDGDGLADIGVMPQSISSGNATLQIFAAAAPHALLKKITLFSHDELIDGRAPAVALADTNTDGKAEILTVAGSRLKIFSPAGTQKYTGILPGADSRTQPSIATGLFLHQ